MHLRLLRAKILLSAGLIAAVLMVACSAEVKGQSPDKEKKEHRRGLVGYLHHTAIPNSEVVIPPPPAQGSTAFAVDQEISRRSLALRGTPRWQMAVRDAALSFPEAAATFACALGVVINENDTPHLITLLQRVMKDAGFSTLRGKNRYKRQRPFLVNGEPTCTPMKEDHLKNSGAYPSGHAAAGWAWALVLCELAPDRADEILVRGRAFGQSRVICNVHWQSDVEQGRMMGAATVARLHADPGFQADLAAARAELDALRRKGAEPDDNCDAEGRLIQADDVRKNR